MNTNYVAARRRNTFAACCFDFSEIKVNLLAECEYFVAKLSSNLKYYFLSLIVCCIKLYVFMRDGFVTSFFHVI